MTKPFFNLTASALAGVLMFPGCAANLPVSSVNNRVLLVIGQDAAAIDDYVRAFGHVPDGVMAYTSLQHLEGLTSPADHGGGIQHAESLLEKYPGAFLQLGVYLVDVLPQISHGLYDQNIQRLADWLKTLPVDVYLRIGYEFDGPHNRYDPQAYISAYRRIVDFLRKKNVRNVYYVWHSYAEYVDGSRMRWYPGDEYVDFIGMSFFNPYSSANHSDVVRIARNTGKPLIIAESTPYRIGVDDPAAWTKWFHRYFDFIRDHDVRMFCYINWKWDDYRLFQAQGWGNARLQDNVQIREKWIEELHRRGYIRTR